ncbi:alpha/beta fold hydrolase [Actinomycetospora callitridis]|uniref:alpha/beta fold hydrolase n=1 Tax=Actinomycetospora callitridis TaxID=913944 RepID=UPI002366C84E|nr:alpha/beta fold hydrolase [Actinomycetospora callitridis]MDD7916863.1 alpha/beta fold hydrolase [Actinomycetospora callitridis]
MTVFVLVHGGWHGGWCWRRVASRLRASGHEVHTPTLTGVGDRAHLGTPDTGLATHVEDVLAVLEIDDLREVVLVGHSSGGAVITGVAQRASHRLARLTYLDAFVPAPGQSVFDLLPPARRDHFRALVDDVGRIVLDPDVAMDGWGLRTEDDRAFVRARLRPHPLGGLADPLPGTPLPDLPRHFVHCAAKPAPDVFAAFGATVGSGPRGRLDVLDAGHDAMITAPDQVAALLMRE